MTELPANPACAGWEGSAFYLPLDPHHVLCHLQEPAAAARRDTAVLFCSPFGWDDMTSYRARRNWAQRLAQSGYPAVRFDLPTSGDSGGDPSDAGRLAIWAGAVQQMIAWAPERLGCERLAVFGFGLGGLLAWQAIADGARVDELLLWAVPSNGRSLVREQWAHAQVVAAGYAREHQPTGASADEDDELIGYLLTSDTAAELRALKPGGRPAAYLPSRVLLLGRDDLPVAAPQEAYFRENAAEVRVEGTEDFDALFALPQRALTPVATIERSVAWLGERTPVSRRAGADNGAGSADMRHAGRKAIEFEHGGKRLREEVIEFEHGGQRISGVLTTPLEEPSEDATALLLSAGALRRTGVSRVWVELARRWGGRGVASLRFDQPGVGDSSGDERLLASNTALYAPASTQVVLGAMEWLAARGLPERYLAVGSCSGAYWSLHTALADKRIACAVMINLYAFDWSEQLMAERSTKRALGALRSRLWQRLLHGDITAAELRSRARSISPQRLRRRLAASAEREQQAFGEYALDALRDQGTDVLFILSERQPLLRQLSCYGPGSRLDRWPNVTIERMASPDSLFRALPLQREVHAAADRALDRVVGADLERGRPPAPWDSGSPADRRLPSRPGH